MPRGSIRYTHRMTRLPVTRTPDGRAFLHVWRSGVIYEEQKGPLFTTEWTSLRFSRLPEAARPGIRPWDVTRPLPFDDATFEAAYLMHVLEHLTPDEARYFACELYRVLKPGAVLRLSTPDLEGACRHYIECLDAWDADPSGMNAMAHEWAVMEIIDQATRDRPGGRIAEAARAGRYDPERVRVRYGDVFAEFAPESPDAHPSIRVPASIIQRLKGKSASQLWHALRRRLTGSYKDPRRSGEANRWMWDRVSLSLLLQSCGFRAAGPRRFDESDIPGWERYQFDRSNLGNHPIEPSVYVEARK